MHAKQKRWIKSLLETAEKTELKMPYARGHRAKVAARLKAKAAQKAA
ncbi:hypothetical protein ACRARG_06400 [Pseudooceanicola sp. C21-150M6]